MTLKDFIAANYDAFIDDVVGNIAPEEWQTLLGGEDTAPDTIRRMGTLAGLRMKAFGWRKRMELDAALEGQSQWWAQQNEDAEWIADCEENR